VPIPEALLADIRGLARKSADWFSIDEIKKRDPDLEVAARYIKKGTGEELIVPRNQQQVHERLEDWAARLLEREVRLYEDRLWELCSENSAVPSTRDDTILKEDLRQYLDVTVRDLQTAIAQHSQYTPPTYGMAQLKNTVARLETELLITLPLAAEITRLEMLNSGYDPIDRIGYAQIKIERFLSKSCVRIPHPFNEKESATLLPAALQRAIRLFMYVVFKKVEEPRLKGFEDKFVSVFLRYLTSSRESSGSVVEQISALLEPFLKKLSFLFAVKDANSKLLWPSALDPLIAGLHLTTSDLRKSDKTYWLARPTHDAVLRLAYQLRHKGAHEAHDHPYYEHERHAYFVFAAMVLACATLLQAHADIAKTVDHQETADALRDLFVRIEGLILGRDGPRISGPRNVPPTRLEKLVELANRAQAIWPHCSTSLPDLLEAEYNAVREQLAEADREAEIEAYIDAMRSDEY